MKKIFTVFLLLFTVESNAQLGFFYGQFLVRTIGSWNEGGYEVKYTFFNNEPAFMHGIRGGWFVDQEDRFLIGISAYFASTRLNERISIMNSQKMYMLNSTFYLDYTIYPEKSFNINPQLHLGGGVTGLSGGIGNTANLPTSASYFLLEPDINFCLKLGGFAKVGTGFGYRLLSNFKIHGATSGSLSGPVINMFIKFGSYK